MLKFMKQPRPQVAYAYQSLSSVPFVILLLSVLLIFSIVLATHKSMFEGWF